MARHDYTIYIFFFHENGDEKKLTSGRADYINLNVGLFKI